jgi:hypothetical protein
MHACRYLPTADNGGHLPLEQFHGVIERSHTRSAKHLPVGDAAEERSPSEVFPDHIEHVIQLTVARQRVLLVTKGERAVQIEGQSLAEHLHVHRHQGRGGFEVEDVGHRSYGRIHFGHHLYRGDENEVNRSRLP